MNNIKLYTKSDVGDAKKALCNTGLSIVEYSLEIEKSNVLNSLIELSKSVVETSGDIDLAIGLDQNEYFQNLTKKEAFNEEFWATINIEYFSEYTQNRWLCKHEITENMILQRVFKAGNLLYNRNSIARLWWAVKRTKDDNLNDPYMYTRILLTRAQFEQSIFESSISKNKEVLLNLMASIVKFENKYWEINSTEIKKIIKRFNLLGGTYILDIMDQDFYYNEIISVLGVQNNSESSSIFDKEYKNTKGIF